MKGVVEEISRETSKKGDNYLRVKVGGEKYSVWDEKYFDLFHEGDTIEFEYKESGQWKNIVDLTVPGSGNEELSEREQYLRTRDRQIARMSCVKSVAYVLANLDSDAESKGAETLSLAKIFEKYVYEDDLDSDG